MNERLKVLLVAYYAEQASSPGSRRPAAMARILPTHGIDVTTLCYSESCRSVDVSDEFVLVGDFPKTGAWRFIYYLMVIGKKLLGYLGIYKGIKERWKILAVSYADEILKSVKPDLIICSYPPLEALEVGLALAEIGNIPLVSDFRDGLIFEGIEVASLSHACSREFSKEIERKVAKASILLVTVSPPITNYFLQTYHHNNCHTLYNGFDEVTEIDGANYLPNDRINIVHTGRLGKSRIGTEGDALFLAIDRLSLELPELGGRMCIHFVGDLSIREVFLARRLIRRGLVCVWGDRPASAARAFQRDSDILLLIVAAGVQSVVTTKLFEYLRAGVPILALAEGSVAGDIVQESGHGVVVTADDPDAIQRQLKKVMLGEFPEVVSNQFQIDQFARVRQMTAFSALLKSALEK